MPWRSVAVPPKDKEIGKRQDEAGTLPRLTLPAGYLNL